MLEKGEIVKRVTELVKEERKRLERQAREEEAEEAALAGTSIPDPPVEQSTESEVAEGARVSAELKRPLTGPPASVERDGLCVVCQDQEAQLAVVDCGHLSMCQDCSKLVMNVSTSLSPDW